MELLTRFTDTSFTAYRILEKGLGKNMYFGLKYHFNKLPSRCRFCFKFFYSWFFRIFVTIIGSTTLRKFFLNTLGPYTSLISKIPSEVHATLTVTLKIVFDSLSNQNTYNLSHSDSRI